MKSERLLELFEKVGEAPGAVERLRTLALDLAIRGKLVPQKPSDGSVEPLLAMAIAKLAMTERPSSVPQVSIDAPYRVPDNWRWVALGSLAIVRMGQSPPGDTYNARGEGVPLINGPVEFSPGPFGRTVINQYTTAPAVTCDENDLLVCVRGSTTGRTNVASCHACIGRGVAAIRPVIPDEYLRLVLWRWREKIIAMGRGIAFPSVSRVQLETLPVPLPPPAEQERIVARVTELLGTCDQLESAYNRRERRRDQLVTASLQRMREPVDEPAVFGEHAAWHIGRMTTRVEHVRELREALIELAVMGRLGTQRSSDEPAIRLWERLTKEVAIARRGGASTSLQTRGDADQSRDLRLLPQSWRWIHLGDLVRGASAGWSPKAEGFPRIGDNWGVLKVSAVSWDSFRAEENKQLLPGATPPDAAVVREGDFLISRANTSALVAKCVIVREAPHKLILSDKIVRLRLSREVEHDYVRLVNNHARYARAYYAQRASGTSLSMKNVSRDVIYELPLPLPPREEQRRILEVVTTLEELCRKLEQGLGAVACFQTTLLDTLLKQVVG